ncbi:hypothetical protein DRI50_10085 [candidate division KSB1 bacterium]|nr:MAG: hypothetical protein DRI50_10085 [candidate division KSB1 bacterium]
MNRVAKRYTKALFELAQERQMLDKVEKDMEEIRKLIDESDDFREFLANPLITESAKQEIVRELFADRIQPLTLQFLELLTEKRRIAILPAVVEQFREMLLEYQHILEGELISAVPLEKKQFESIKKHLENMLGQTVTLQSKIQPEIIGGFVVRIQDMVIDNSIRLQLNKLREKLSAR